VLTLPVSALAFGQIPLLSPLTNLLILWAVTICFGLGLLVSLLGFFWPAGAVLAGWPARLLVRYISFVVKTVGRLPFASLYPDNRMLALWLILFYALLLFFRFWPGLRRHLRPCLLGAAASLLVCLFLGVLLYRQDDLLTGFLDVGQGQCVVLTGKDFAVAVDCGSLNSAENAGDTAARYLLSRGRTRLDALILSHYDADHRNGALELLRRIKVGRLLVPPPGEDPLALELLREAEALGTEVDVVDGETEEVRFGGLRGTVVPPLGRGGPNDTGLCVLLSLGEYDVLLTGDASAETELRLLEWLELPDVELMAVGHHGSRHSSCRSLLAAAAPDVAVISVGRNSFGLPSEDALRRLLDAGAAVYRTDWNGTVEIAYQERKGAGSHG
jgi:competence protein ComEC